MCLYLSIFHHWNITLFYFWYTQVQSLFSSSYHGKIKSKNRKNSVRKSYSTGYKALVAIRKKKKLVKVKTQHWGVLIIWKRGNKIKAAKTGVTLKDLSLTISNLRTTAFCFENIKLLKQILNNMSFVMAKNRSSST